MSSLSENEIPGSVFTDDPSSPEAPPSLQGNASGASKYITNRNHETIPRRSIETDIPNLIPIDDIPSSPDARAIRAARHSLSIDDQHGSLLSPSRPNIRTSIIYQFQNIEPPSAIDGYSPLKPMLYLLLTIGVVVLIVIVYVGLLSAGKFDTDPNHKFKDRLGSLIISNFVGGILNGYLFLYPAYLCIDAIHRPSRLILFAFAMIEGLVGVIMVIILLFVAYHPFFTFLVVNTAGYISELIIAGLLVARYDLPKCKPMLRFLIAVVICYYYGIAFLVLFYSIHSNSIRSLLLVLFSGSLIVIREYIRCMIPANFPISIRVNIPYFLNLAFELFIASVFPSVDSIYIFLLVFVIQISTNLFQPLIIKRQCWEVKQKVKNYFNIQGQYPNQTYEDYVLRSSNDYIFTLFSQLTSHILFLGMFLSAYHGFNADHYAFNSVYVSDYSYKLVVSFTSIQIVSIAIQTLIARKMIINFYRHDPFRLCYYLLKTNPLLFFLSNFTIQFLVLNIITFDNDVLYYFL